MTRISETKPARIFAWVVLLGAVLRSSVAVAGTNLPGHYFELLNTGVARIEKRLTAEPAADLQTLESSGGWKHFPSAILVTSVLYTQPHPANSRRGDAKLLSLAQQIGDLLTSEHARGYYTTRLDHHRDTYMWLEGYRLLERELGAERRARWRGALTNLIAALAADVAEKQDFPWYQSPFISTSPNHYALWAKTVFLGGKVFGNEESQRLGARVLHRFVTEEQAPDGYWGEWSRNGPTTGYDYLTMAGVALYYEHSHDPAALEALRRSTDFHKFFTWPDGTPVETINDRNRYWGVSPWGHFGFSHFADGRRYAEFLTSFFTTNDLSLETLRNCCGTESGAQRKIDPLERRGRGQVDSTSRLDADSPASRTRDVAGLPLQSVSQRPGDRPGPCGGDGLIHTHRKTGTRFCCRKRLISRK